MNSNTTRTVTPNRVTHELTPLQLSSPLIASSNPKSDNATDLDANSNTSTQANTYNIPVRTNGITEKVSAINEDSFTGVTRNRTARYYLYGIS